MLLAVLVAMAELSSQAPPASVKLPTEPARGHPLVVLHSDAAHPDFQERLAETLLAGGIATFDLGQNKGWTRGEIDEQFRGARLFGCAIGPAPLRWPATRPPSAEILLFPKKVAENAHRPRLIVTFGRRVEPKHRYASDSWLTLPSAELTPETEHQISEAVVLWVLARSGAKPQKSMSSPPPPP
jgi:hypothetical protein